MAIPNGIIALWSGTIVDIPANWALCDGGDGRPDLRNYFLIGAGDIYNPGDTGGATNHTHTINTVGHSHVLAAGANVEGGAVFRNETNTVAPTGTALVKNHLPPYYALAYIIKVSDP